MQTTTEPKLFGSITGWMPGFQDVRRVRKRIKRFLSFKPPAAICVDRFEQRHPELMAAKDNLGREISSLCRFDKLDSAEYRQWLSALELPWRTHRKLWELAYICQVLHERNLLQPGRRGLGFAVGQEVLPAFFAARGVDIQASDLAASDTRNIQWAQTGQWAAGLEALYRPNLCDDEQFRKHVHFRAVDMNNIPDDLTGFDFTWSTCSFEHCGSIELGLRFLREQMKCLKPGGIAVHTTEFNLTSNLDTRVDGNCVLFRLQDIERVCLELTQAGHCVEPICIDVGDHPLDRKVDLPPYHQEKHLRLELFNYAATSIGLIIHKGNH